MIITLYEILGVPENASTHEIKNAYRRMALLCHPDKNNGSQESRDLFLKVNEAYCVLSDEKKRIDYDTRLEAYRFRVKAQQNPNRQRTDDSFNRSFQNETRKTSNKHDQNESFGEVIVDFLKDMVRGAKNILLRILPLSLIILTMYLCSREENDRPQYNSYQSNINDSDLDNSDISDNNISNTKKRNRTQLNTGDKPYKNEYGVGRFDRNSLSSIDIKNGTTNDAIVLLYNVLDNTTYRHVYIMAGEDYTMSEIPEGLYDLKVYHGTGWNAYKNNGNNMPKGGFDHDESYSHSESSDFFNVEFTRTYDGISYSTYSVTLHKVRNGNMSTESISKDSFFK